MNIMKVTKTTLLLLTIFLITTFPARATRPDPTDPALKDPKPKGGGHHRGRNDDGGFFGPGGGFGIPGFDKGWDPTMGGGYGYGYGGPTGGYSKGGTIRPSTVCKEQGPCYMKKLRCPAKCFTSFSRSGKGYGAGGGGGGCTMDCKTKCVAYC